MEEKLLHQPQVMTQLHIHKPISMGNNKVQIAISLREGADLL